MSIARKRRQTATTGPKTAIAALMLQAESAVIEAGIYQGSLSEWLAEAAQALKGAYHLAFTPIGYIEDWGVRKKLILTMDGGTLTVTGMEPFTPTPKPPVAILRELFE